MDEKATRWLWIKGIIPGICHYWEVSKVGDLSWGWPEGSLFDSWMKQSEAGRPQIPDESRDIIDNTSELIWEVDFDWVIILSLYLSGCLMFYTLQATMHFLILAFFSMLVWIVLQFLFNIVKVYQLVFYSPLNATQQLHLSMNLIAFQTKQNFGFWCPVIRSFTLFCP